MLPGDLLYKTCGISYMHTLFLQWNKFTAFKAKCNASQKSISYTCRVSVCEGGLVSSGNCECPVGYVTSFCPWYIIGSWQLHRDSGRFWMSEHFSYFLSDSAAVGYHIVEGGLTIGSSPNRSLLCNWSKCLCSAVYFISHCQSVCHLPATKTTVKIGT